MPDLEHMAVTLPVPDVTSHTAFLVSIVHSTRAKILAAIEDADADGKVLVSAQLLRDLLATVDAEARLVDRHRKDPPPQTNVQVNVGGPLGSGAGITDLQHYLLHRLAHIPEACEIVAQDMADPNFSLDSVPRQGTKKTRQVLDITPKKIGGK